MTERSYRIDELAHAAGMSVRTVRYYVQRGLLPPAAFRGKDTAYDHAHLVRLRAIRRLQEAFFPLDAIAAGLEGRSAHEIEAIADGRTKPVSAVGGRESESESGRERESGSGRGPGAEQARAEIAPQTGRVFRRIDLFPGVELTVAEDAPDKSVRLVEEMLAILEAMSTGREGGRKR